MKSFVSTVKTSGISAVRLAFGAVLLAGMTLSPLTMARADQLCPDCALPIVKNIEGTDYEAVLTAAGKNVSYRCAQCAIADSCKYRGDLTLLAPSEKAGNPVQLRRLGGVWSGEPGALYMSVPVSHRKCQVANRAFHTKAGFDAYAAKNRDVVGDAKPMTLAQFVQSAE